MDFKDYSVIEQLALKLSLCRGIGLAGKWKVLRFAQKFLLNDLTENEIVKIADLERYQSIFRQSWRMLTKEYLTEFCYEQTFITFFSEFYPVHLKEIPYPPLVLFYAGNLDLLAAPSISFVGARQATSYAKEVVAYLLPKLIEEHFVIVSGLAKGVDSLSHRETITLKGNTIAVIGCGLDTCYPRENLELFEYMKKEQLVISEYPQKTPIKKFHFPMRNRIIAGLTQATCVIEAKQRSGSLITAQLAAEYGREVFAVPGNIMLERATGCHQLIQDGAKCVNHVQDILDEIQTLAHFLK